MPKSTIKPGVPHDLEQQTSERFEQLLSEGQIVWQPYKAQNAEDQGFKVQFQKAPQLKHKPSNPLGSTGGKHGNGNDPFANPDPAFVIAHPGPNHTLMLNKFPVYRDSLIVHTNDFQLQSDDLTESDLAACWASLQALCSGDTSNQRQWVMIYNCGRQAGSSQGHKHMQLWPIPSTSRLWFEKPVNGTYPNTDFIVMPNLPFKHFMFKLSPYADDAEVWEAYMRLLLEVKHVHKQHGSTAYNVAMTSGWLMLVPRRSSGGGLGFGGNTAVVLGLLWVSSSHERHSWEKYGIAKHLARLGVPA